MTPIVYEDMVDEMTAKRKQERLNVLEEALDVFKTFHSLYQIYYNPDDVGSAVIYVVDNGSVYLQLQIIYDVKSGTSGAFDEDFIPVLNKLWVKQGQYLTFQEALDFMSPLARQEFLFHLDLFL